VRVRFKWNDERLEPDLLFRSLPQKNIWAPFSFSTLVQTAVVWIGVSYLHFLTTLPPDSIFEVRKDRVLDLSSEPLEYHAPAAPSLAEDGLKADGLAADRPAASAATQSPRAEVPRQQPAESGLQVPLPAPSLPARDFRMPPVRVAPMVAQTLLQMDLPPTMDLHQQLRVPSIVMLASTPRRTAPKPFVAPPHRKTTMEVPSQVALEMRPPILDVRAGYAKTPEVLSAMSPKLPAPVGAVAPVASNREPVEAKPDAATVTGNAVADPSNIISLPDRPIPAASAMVLPPLNQVSGRDTAAGTAGPMDPSGGEAFSGKPGSGNPAGPSNLQNTQTGVGAGSAAAHGGAGASTAANTSGNSPGGHAPGADSGTDHAGNSASGATGSGTKAGAGASGKSGVAGGTPGPTRLIRPTNGAYEVAIVQASGVVPGSSGLLKGKPVYSVYIPVGTGKEWILQYCVPADYTRPAARSQVVQLGSITPITAPYAFSIVGPAIQFRMGARYAFIHGFVNVSGRFEHLAEASDQEIENIGTVLESLGQWEFRPATKDGVPAMVEILLCIPNAA
jgi:hypothetical protein